jgi:hypothetical protein
VTRNFSHLPEPIPQPSDPSDARPSIAESTPTITLRAVLLGVISFSAVVHLLRLSVSSQLPLMVLISFVFWLFANAMLRTVMPRLALKRGELLTIFVVGWVVGTIPSNGWMWDLVKLAAIPTHVAGPENQWAETIFDLLPWHTFASTEERVINGVWFGLDRGASVPWSGWFESVGQWLGVSMGMVVLGFCTFVLFHRQWVDREKLTFPLAQMPLDLTVGCDGPGRVPQLFRSRLFWIGVALVFLPAAYDAVTYFLPGLPMVKIFFDQYPIDLGPHISRGLAVRFMPLVLAVAYLCPLDILASLIVFSWLTLPKEWMMNRTGFAVGSEGDQMGALDIMYMESHGAFIFIAIWSIWLARRHLQGVWRQAWNGEGAAADVRRYRWALLGLAVSATYVTLWIMALGASLLLAAGLLLLLVAVNFVTVKLMAATGFAYLIPNAIHIKGESFIVNLVGTKFFSPRSVVGFSMFTSNVFFGSGGRIPCWPAIVHHLRIFSIERQPVWVTTTIFFSFAVGFLSIAGTTISEAYGMMVQGLSGNEVALNNMVRLINNPTVASAGKWGVWFTGFVEAAGVAWLRTRFHWFPFHPVGLAFQYTIGVRLYWFSLLVVWIAKFTLLRFGGVRRYAAAKPLFYGMLVGYVLGIVVARGVDRIWFPGVSHWLHRW